MPPTPHVPWPAVESLVRRDPGGRGVANFAIHGSPLCPGHLLAAARHLAEHATVLGIVTGFAIVNGESVAAETDGPPGALFLARALAELGAEVILITDRYCRPALEVGCDFYGLPREILQEFPLEDAASANVLDVPGSSSATPRADGWVEAFLKTAPGNRLSHLVAVERVGPSHTRASLHAQRRSGTIPDEDFQRLVPSCDRDVCHNMRGVSIDRFTGRIHRLFELVKAVRPSVATIGIGDGGNEIGLGSIPWETLCRAITIGPAERVACRIATDFTLLSGVSDWGAYALALAVCRWRGRAATAAHWDAHNQRGLIEALVQHAGTVDGVTGRREATVDGLPLETYLQVFGGVRDLLLD